MMDGKWAGNPDGDILFYGRLAHDKGVDVLLDALEGTKRRIQIVGRGESEADLRVQARERGLLDRIEWTPWLEPDALRSTMEQAAMVVLPSRAESFGNAMAEALAVGVPLVTTDAGSIPGVVGDTALCVPRETRRRPSQVRLRRWTAIRKRPERSKRNATDGGTVPMVGCRESIPEGLRRSAQGTRKVKSLEFGIDFQQDGAGKKQGGTMMVADYRLDSDRRMQ